MRTDLTPNLAFLFGISRPYRATALVVIGLCVLASAFDGFSIGMLVPLIGDLQQMTETVPAPFRWVHSWTGCVPQGRWAYALIGFVVAAVALKNLFIALSIRWGHWLSSRLVADVRIAAVRRVLFAGVALHDRSSPGDLLDQVLGNTQWLEAFLRVAVEFIANALTLAVLVGLLFVLSWPLALLALGFGGAFLLYGLGHVKSLAGLGAAVAAAEGRALRALHESLGGIRLIKSYSRERRHVHELEQLLDTARGALFRRNFKVFSIHPITDVAATGALAALLFAALALDGGDTRTLLARLLPFLFVLLRIVPLLKILNSQKAELISRWPYLSLVRRLLQAREERPVPDGDKPFRGLKREIRLDGVTFAYPSRLRPALTHVRLSIPAGKTTAIIGESGSGKSTLAHLLLRLYDPQEGDIRLDGEPLRNFRLATYHRRIGSVSQDTYLFNQTVRFNIAYGAKIPPTHKSLIEAAKQAQAHDFILALPEGYDTVIGDRGVHLSGGQRQRLALARAILLDPEILILDEATSALDPQTEHDLQAALRTFGSGRTVIVIAHRPATIANADQVVVLRNGRVAEVRVPTPLSLLCP
jgi:ABC-type multidrug transport system fused ATPase/permease subunit